MSNQLFTDYLVEELGMAGTRALSLTEALGHVHSSIGAMDNFNRGIMRKHFPDLMELVATYADHDYMLDNYKD